MRNKILVSAPLDFLPSLKQEIMSEFDCIYAYQSTEEEIKEILASHPFDGWMVAPCPTYYIDKKLLDLCTTLRIIATPSTGSNHLNIDDITNKGIEIYTLKDTEVVDKIVASSEFTFNLLISTIRKTPYSFRSVLDGKWRDVEGKFRGRELNELTLGIIGFGRIGKNLAKYSSAFGMKILAYDPYVDIPKDSGIYQCDSLEELLPQVDVISPCVHLSEDTYHMINSSVFNQMKDGVYFINTSRGDVVNESDLIKNLKSGKIIAAGVDVISDEFLGDKDEHILIKYAKNNNNLIITPHIAGLTYDSERKAQTAAYIAIKNCLNRS
jgi:phosphoglycerate dehydrogenase-like enzyme